MSQRTSHCGSLAFAPVPPAAPPGAGVGAGSGSSSSSGSLSTASKLAALRVARAKAARAQHLAGISTSAPSSSTGAVTPATLNPNSCNSLLSDAIPSGGLGGGASAAQQRFHIAFHLRPVVPASSAAGSSSSSEKAVPVSSAAFKKLVHDEYLCAYLESLGVTPSRATLEQARAHLPPEELRVTAAWKHDVLTVAPLDRATVAANARAKVLAQQHAKQKARRAKTKQLQQQQQAATTSDGNNRHTASGTGGAEAEEKSGASNSAPSTAAAVVVPGTRVEVVSNSSSAAHGTHSRSRSTSRSGSRSRSRSRSRTPSTAHNTTTAATKATAPVSATVASVAASTTSAAPVRAGPPPPKALLPSALMKGNDHARLMHHHTQHLLSSSSSSRPPATASLAAHENLDPERVLAERAKALERFWAAGAAAALALDNPRTGAGTAANDHDQQQLQQPQRTLDEEKQQNSSAHSGTAAQAIKDAFAAAARAHAAAVAADKSASRSGVAATSAGAALGASNIPKGNSVHSTASGQEITSVPSASSPSAMPSPPPPPPPPPALQVFSLAHMLAAHDLPQSHERRNHHGRGRSQNWRYDEHESSDDDGAFEEAEEDAELVARKLRKKKQRERAQAAKLLRAPQGQSKGAGNITAAAAPSLHSPPPPPPMLHVLYFCPSRAAESSAVTAATADGSTDASSAAAAVQVSSTSVAGPSSTTTTESSSSSEDPYAPALPSGVSAASLARFSLDGFNASSSMCFPALVELFHRPPVVDVVREVPRLVAAFLALVSKYQHHMERTWWRTAGGADEDWWWLTRRRRHRRHQMTTMHETTEENDGEEEDVWCFSDPRRRDSGFEEFGSSAAVARSIGAVAARAFASGLHSYGDGQQRRAGGGTSAAATSSSSYSSELVAGGGQEESLKPPLRSLYPHPSRFDELVALARTRFVPAAAAATGTGGSSSSNSNASANACPIGELVGLLVHYAYHVVFRPQLAAMRRFRVAQAAFVRAQTPWNAHTAGAVTDSQSHAHQSLPVLLSRADLSALSLRIQQLFLDHRERLHVLPRFSSFFLPLFVDLLGTLVLQMLHSRYPRWFRSGWGVPTDQRILGLVQRLCDPQSGDKERSNMTMDESDTQDVLNRLDNTAADATADDSPLASSRPHSLFFHTSSLIRSAVPQPSAAEARLVRKDDSSSLSSSSRSAREWRNAAAVAAVRAGAGAITARAAASANAPLNQTILNSARGDARIGVGVRDTNPFSLSARFAAAEAQRQAEELRRQRLPTLRAAHARATAAQAVAARAAAASASSSQPRRPTTSSSAADPYAVPSVFSAPAEAGSSSPRRALFELGLRKVAHRHARDNVYARALIAQMPGLVTSGGSSAAAAPASPRRLH